ncbi:MAG: hypothetical protein HY078_09365 [Elusimicrobia bacterium]|nr:hypothetical protein [Elusimicrobiota bacterium]
MNRHAADPSTMLRLRESALVVLRRHHFGDDDVKIEANEPGKPPSCLITGHRVRVQLDERSATFRAKSGRWSGDLADFPTMGAFLAAFEESLESALSA